jgi:hypothetical protein
MTESEILKSFARAVRFWMATSFCAAACIAANIFNAHWLCNTCRRLKNSEKSWRKKCDCLARQLGVRFIFVEKEHGKLALRRGFKISPDEKILVVEDVVTKGGRVQETIDIVKGHAGQVVGVAMVVDPSNNSVNFRFPTFSLLAMQVEMFEPDSLPSDLAAIPAIKPGSK